MPSIAINRFVFHVLKKGMDGFDVTYLTEAALGDQARSFFEALVEKHLQGIRYHFDQPDSAPEPAVKRQTQDLFKGGADLIATSRELTRDFADRHAAQATEGVFIIATATLDRRPVLVLMKYDHIEAIELLTDALDGAPSARYTDDVLTLDERNVKKFALVDLSGTEGWDVVATDRQTPPIADYFRGFLGVRPVRTAQEHTDAAIRTVRKWAAATKTLPSGTLPVDVQFRVVDFMRQMPTFSVPSILDRLLGAETDANRQALADLRQTLAEADLISDFQVDASAVRGALGRQTMVTREGVRIVMPNGPEQGHVTVDTVDGRSRIIIDTDEIKTQG